MRACACAPRSSPLSGPSSRKPTTTVRASVAVVVFRGGGPAWVVVFSSVVYGGRCLSVGVCQSASGRSSARFVFVSLLGGWGHRSLARFFFGACVCAKRRGTMITAAAAAAASAQRDRRQRTHQPSDGV